MCQFKTNEYTQTTLLGVELLRVTFYVWIFPLNLPQVGNLECNNMASTNVCRLDSRSSVNLFTAIGLICNFTSYICNSVIYVTQLASRISPPSSSWYNDQMLTSHACTKCTLGLVALEKAEIDPHAFKQHALSSLIGAIKFKRPKVTGGEVGVSSDTIRAKAKQSRRHILLM